MKRYGGSWWKVGFKASAILPLGRESPFTRSRWGWVNLTVCRTLRKRENSELCRESNADCPVVHCRVWSLYRLRYSGRSTSTSAKITNAWNSASNATIRLRHHDVIHTPQRHYLFIKSIHRRLQGYQTGRLLWRKKIQLYCLETNTTKFVLMMQIGKYECI